MVGLGLYIAVLGDRGIARRKASAAERRQLEAQAFRGLELTVGLRWVFSAFVLGTIGLLDWFALIAVPTIYSRKGILAALLFAALGTVLLVGLLSLLRTMWSAARDGLLVQMDSLGLTLWGRPFIAWSLVEGIDLEEVEVKGRTQHRLVLALHRSHFSSAKFARFIDWLHWTAPRCNVSSRTLTVPCALLDVDPHLMTQAAKVLADRFGSCRVIDWTRHIHIDKAIASKDRLAAMENVNRDVDKLVARLSLLDSNTPTAAAEISKVEEKLQSTLLQGKELSDAHMRAYQSQVEEMSSKLIKLKWLGALLFVLAVAALGLQVTSILGR